MSVKVILDKPYGHFTNLDYISGRAVLTLAIDTPITTISVKLEGESLTRLVGLRYPHSERSDKKRTEVEVHKLLYKVATVFPNQELLDHGYSTAAYYTLSPGTYEYPFRFKLPFNNDCINNNQATNVSMAGIKVEVARDWNEHVKQTLPPSLNSFPGRAEIKYYVKATVSRPQFYKENYRDFAAFNFLPIEPPRKEDPGKETYARRQHHFNKTPSEPQKKGLFQKKTPASPLDSQTEGPRYAVDVRLPNPPILTCNEPIPLRILVKKLNDSADAMSLQILQIELINYTHIRAHDIKTSEHGSWVLLSQSNMNFPLGNGTEPVGYEWTLDSSTWNRLPLPSSVAPSFDACNISRTYKLDVRVGLARTPPGSGKPELIVLPLQLPVNVYSGIKPPKSLLDAMGAKPGTEEKAEPTPPQPPRPSAPAEPAPAELETYEEAPPSYEDAMAEELGPVDGPRREYNPPDTISRPSGWTGTDVKDPVGDNKDEERLFPNSGPSNSTTESVEVYNWATPTTQSVTPVDQNRPELSTRHSSPEQPPGGLAPQQEGRTRTTSPFMGVPNRKPVPSPSKEEPPSR